LIETIAPDGAESVRVPETVAVPLRMVVGPSEIGLIGMLAEAGDGR
jgi:hypothetical protein